MTKIDVMKKMSAKIALLGILSILTFGTLTTGCSKDDDGHEEPDKGTIDAAVGTYKGKISSGDLPQFDYYNAVIIVTKVDHDHLKISAKSDEAYSTVTEKIMKIIPEYGGEISSVTGDLSGSFWYRPEANTVSIFTNKQVETDVEYHFEGTKQ